AGAVHMVTDPLNFESLMGELGEGDTWTGAPDGTVIGHVHLRVGDVKPAEAWWNDVQGLDTMAHYGDKAVFLSSGGYHHHIGANSWQSRGAGLREADRTGLSFVDLLSKEAAAQGVSADPWGTEIRVLPV